MATRDPSYASKRLTRSSYHGPSLHPYLKSKPIPVNKPVDEVQEASIQTHEPNWDDLPLSSDESVASENRGKDDIDELPPARVTVDHTDEGRSHADTAKRKPINKRSYSQQNGPGSDDEPLSIFPSSQSSKTKYRSRNNPPLSSQPPSSSVENEPPQPRSKFQPPRSISVAAQPPPKNESEDDVPAFRMPKVVDSKPAPRTRKKLKMPGENRRRLSSGFQNPLDVRCPGEPPSLPSTAVSRSSLTSKELVSDDDESSLSSLSSVPSDGMPSFFADEQRDEKKNPRRESEESLCPMCKAPVDPGLLQEFLRTSNRRIREQQRFCEAHKIQTAEKEWTDRGYPKIDWEDLDQRIRGYFPDIDRLLVPNCTSFYRDILAAKLKSGKAQNFRIMMFDDDLDNMSCGYYGSKGASRMLHIVTSEFSRKLRQLASVDNILKTAGVAAYAQTVIVPELTVFLVKEDMNVNDKDARQILRDSMAIGEQLNPAENDVIHVSDDDLASSP